MAKRIMIQISQSFSEELPPRITVQTTSGYSHVGPAGEVLVYPGSILNLDCAFNRKLGNPDWSWARGGKDYPKGRKRVGLFKVT